MPALSPFSCVTSGTAPPSLGLSVLIYKMEQQYWRAETGPHAVGQALGDLQTHTRKPSDLQRVLHFRSALILSS